MRITYEEGDFVERLNWIESCDLVIKSITVDGVIVTLHEPSASRMDSYGEEFVSGKFFTFDEIWPRQSTLRNAVLVVGTEEVKLSELFDQKFARLMREHELKQAANCNDGPAV